jgi:DNA polymerase-1
LPRTGRVHTHYHGLLAVTDRLSSNDPNLQRHSGQAEGRVRQSLRGSWQQIASADYSQIELRIMAHVPTTRALLRTFTAGLDVHRATAAEVFGVA